MSRELWWIAHCGHDRRTTCCDWIRLRRRQMNDVLRLILTAATTDEGRAAIEYGCGDEGSDVL